MKIRHRLAGSGHRAVAGINAAAESDGDVSTGWTPMQWAVCAWMAVIVIGMLLSVEVDIADQARAEAVAAKMVSAEVARAKCLMANLTEAEKVSMANVVASKLSTPATDSMWLNLTRAGVRCHVDRDDIVSRLEWPAMFNQLAAADINYHRALMAALRKR